MDVDGNGSDTSEDDPVEREIDVYLSKQLAGHLYLLQYPVRPAQMSYDDSEFVSAKIKPKQGKLQFELALNTRSPNYARSKGEQIAINVDGPDPGVSSFYQSDKMDKHVLVSQPSGVRTQRYVAGYLRDGELHVSPLHSIVHMRPSFTYMDKADSKGKDGDADGSQDAADEEKEAKAVTVKFARRETDEAKARRLASYEYMRKKHDEELWVSLNHYSVRDSLSESERQLLYAHHTNDEGEFHIEPDIYLEKLIPKMESKETEKPAMPTNVLSMTDLKKMNAGDQVKTLMSNAKVIGFNQLLSYLPKGVDATAVMRSLQQVALLVQGCWVVKSEILYPKDSSSAHSGAPAEMLCRGRDYIMWRFTQQRCIIRKDIASVIKLHAEDVKSMLEQMSRLKVNKGWEFILDYDADFVSKHPDVVQRQYMIWEAKFKQLSSVLKMPPVDHKLAAQAAANTTPPKRRRTASRSRTKSGGERSMSDMSDNDEGKAERSRRASGGGGAGKRAQPGSGSRDRKRSASGSGSERRPSGPLTDHAASAAISADHVANQNTNDAVQNGPSKNCSDSNEPLSQETNLAADIQRELSTFLRTKLLHYYVLKLSDIRSLLSMELTQLAPGHVLGKGVTDKHIDDAMHLAGGIRMLNAQIKCGEPVFALSGKGDSLDIIRTTLVDVMQKHHQIYTKNLRQAVEDNTSDGGPTFTEADYKKVIYEYCDRKKSNMFALKGTYKLDST